MENKHLETMLKETNNYNYSMVQPIVPFENIRGRDEELKMINQHLEKPHVALVTSKNIDKLDELSKLANKGIYLLVGEERVGIDKIIRAVANERPKDSAIELDVDMLILNGRKDAKGIKGITETLIKSFSDYETEMKKYNDDFRLFIYISNICKVVAYNNVIYSKDDFLILVEFLKKLNRRFDVIASSTNTEFNVYLDNDDVWSDVKYIRPYLKRHNIEEISDDATHEILKNVLKDYKDKSNQPLFTDDIIDAVIKENKVKTYDFEPSKSYITMLCMFIDYKEKNIPVTKERVQAYFKK